MPVLNFYVELDLEINGAVINNEDNGGLRYHNGGLKF